jgi:NAD(P)-dependent dehydrogenase (short-subunit alcohol dehydrogenase family)
MISQAVLRHTRYLSTARNPLRFEGRVCIVTGGSAGIGQAITQALVDEGAKVAVTSLPEDAGKVETKFGKDDVIEFAGDMCEASFCEEVVAGTIDEFGHVHHLVNNAFSFNATGMDAQRSDWDRTMQVGPAAYGQMIQLCAENMKMHATGRSIVNVSSISAHIAQPNRWTYNAAKGATNQLTKCAAMDLGSFGIRINTVSPGWIWTREVEKAASFDRAKWEPVWGKYHMLERLGKTSEVANAVLFLLSDDASFITAAELPVDGGYLSLGPEGLGKDSEFAGSE